MIILQFLTPPPSRRNGSRHSAFSERFHLIRMNSYRKRQHVGRQKRWLPASAYYFLSSAISLAVFFVVWAVLNDAGERSPWIPAGLVASSVLLTSGVMREVVVRRIRNRQMNEQWRLDQILLSVPIAKSQTNPDKLTLERNAAMLNEIQRKSDAAKVLSSIPASHREVFELCDQYIYLVDGELPHVAMGSPRLRPLMKGREYAARFHRYHMLRWAEVEARSLATSAASETDLSRKLDRASQVLVALETAASHYPNEQKLRDSGTAVKDLLASFQARSLIDAAKNAKLLGNDEEFRSLLAEATAVIGRREVENQTSSPVLDELLGEVRDLENDSNA